LADQRAIGMSHPVTTEIDGRIITGTFVASENTVTVSTGGAVKTAHMTGGGGAIDAERVARILLGELARDGKV
jgi:hypothetical protein